MPRRRPSTAPTSPGSGRLRSRAAARRARSASAGARSCARSSTTPRRCGSEFQSAGVTYRPARLTIFSQQVDTACGTQPANVGPFYCPPSFGVYLDPTFFAALSRKVGVHIGDFAQAYVVAHEVAHHVQTLLGITHQKAAADRQDPSRANARSVRFELQADCLAGVWMHSVYRRGELTDADLNQALTAAAVVGDDFIRNAAGRSRPPEEWTHGSAAQRQQWLTTGFEEGRPESCDTFNPERGEP